MSAPPRTPPRAAVARWVLAGVAAAMLVLSPVAAAAAGLEDDPKPTDWPVVKEPTKLSNSGSDPRPLDPPAVAKPPSGQGNDPKPVDWPAPKAP